MIAEDWKRICGIEVVDDGAIACCWIAYDRQSDTIHLYDCANFRREVLAVIAEGITARGRWIPVAWERKSRPMADKLKERGCNITHEGFEDNDAIAEAVARDIWSRMRSGRFKVDSRLAEWKDEFKAFNRADQKVPRQGFPLMTATRFACAMYDEWARPERMPGAGRQNFPKLAVV